MDRQYNDQKKHEQAIQLPKETWTDNKIAKRRRTDNTISKRRKTDNAIDKRRTDNAKAK